MADDLNEFLYRNGLLGRREKAVWTPLAGGVSSDIWRVELPAGTICVKRALSALRVAADWRAPVERSRYEWEWFNFVHQRFPGVVPRPLAYDAEMQMLAMEYLAPEFYTVWKTELLDGVADAGFAARVGVCLGKIHAASAGDLSVAERFATEKLFFALRIEPYLLATARKHADLAPPIEKLAEHLYNAKIALVHGDVSPKNILKHDGDPVFLDAETACFGDPAFDLAFCLNHLLLKSIYRPEKTESYLNCFAALTKNYLAEVSWENPAALEKRAARILPVLFLARVDGKSPVEYLTEESDRNRVREPARRLIMLGAENLAEIAAEF